MPSSNSPFQLPGASHVHLPKRELPPTHNNDLPPERPPKPRKKENTEQQVDCSGMQQSKRQTPRIDELQSKDTAYHSAEGNASIFIDSDTVLDDKRYHYALLYLSRLLLLFCRLWCCFVEGTRVRWRYPPPSPLFPPSSKLQELEVMTLKFKR